MQNSTFENVSMGQYLRLNCIPGTPQLPQHVQWYKDGNVLQVSIISGFREFIVDNEMRLFSPGIFMRTYSSGVDVVQDLVYRYGL